MSTRNHVNDVSTSGEYSVLFNPGVDSIVEELVTSVSALRGVSPVEIPPLYPSVDTDALETLFGTSKPSAANGPYWVTFDYEGFEITICSLGCIVVGPAESS